MAKNCLSVWTVGSSEELVGKTSDVAEELVGKTSDVAEALGGSMLDGEQLERKSQKFSKWCNVRRKKLVDQASAVADD